MAWRINKSCGNCQAWKPLDARPHEGTCQRFHHSTRYVDFCWAYLARRPLVARLFAGLRRLLDA